MEHDIDILYEDNHLIAINKRPGDLSQEDSGREDPLQKKIMDFIKERDQKPGNVYLGTIHRLDKPVSGAMIFAKTSKAAARLAELVRSRKIEKYYLGLAERSPAPVMDEWTELDDFLVRDGDVTRVVDTKTADAQNASLRCATLATDGSTSLNLIELITGRKHQIRAQFASRGSIIIGDERYGSKMKYSEDAIALHSYILRFLHPVKKEMLTIVAPLTTDFSELVDSRFNIGDNDLLQMCMTRIGAEENIIHGDGH